MFSSLIRPSSVRTRTHVNSDVRATSRYDDATPVTAAGAGVAGAGGIGAVAGGVRGGGDGDGSAVRRLSVATPVGRPPDSGSEVRCPVARAPGGRSASVTAQR